MIISSDGNPSPPLNGMIRICTGQNDNSWEEVDLDYETWWEEGSRLVFKGYDTRGHVVLIKMERAITDATVFGDGS